MSDHTIDDDDDITTMKVCNLKAPAYTADRFLLDRCTHPTGPTLIRWQGQWYRWKDGWWILRTDEEVQAEVLHYMEHALDPASAKRIKPANVRDVYGLLVSKAQTPDVEVGHYIGGARSTGLVPCRNGVLDVMTGKLLPHTPRLFNMSIVDVDYKPKASHREWLRFLKSIYPDSPESILLLQEWMGYNLTEDNDQQKIMLMVGAARSGKGTIARIMAELAGPFGLASPTLDTLALPFGLQPLMGRKTAIVSDARLSGGGRVNYQATLERLLTISGDNEVNVDRKFLGTWTGRLSTRFTIITNMLPGLRDEGAAFVRRLLVLHHSVSFHGREDTALTRKLLAELPGILAWAAEGYRRVRKTGKFTETSQSADVIERMDRISSPMKAFLDECCTLDPTVECRKDELRAEYDVWCMQNQIQHPVRDSARFSETIIAATNHSIKPARKRHDGGQVQVFLGISIRREGMDN